MGAAMNGLFSAAASVVRASQFMLLIMLIGILLPAVAVAQEVERKWDTHYFGTLRATEYEAQQDIENYYRSTYGSFGPLDFELKKQTVAANKTIYNYGFKASSPVVTPWVYTGILLDDYATEAAIVMRIEARYISAPGCPAPKASPASGWIASENSRWLNGESRRDSRDYIVAAYYKNSSQSPCTLQNNYESIVRDRDIHCKNKVMLQWNSGLNVCSGLATQEDIMLYWSSSLPAQCDTVGNPCDPTTGDKSEPEPDFDLGWISFGRHYHSMSSTPAGGFGQGWSHSFNIRLTVGVDVIANPSSTTPIFGLIEADGTQSAFQNIGNAYEAINGSGDRIVASGPNWQVFRSSTVMTFDATGRILEQRFEDGASLVYGYDSRTRLSTITHSNGRSLLFDYGTDPDSTLVASISSAGVSLASYTYTTGGQVATVTYPGGGIRTYHYEDTRYPKNLTGITAEDNRRYSWFAYDDKARVISSRHSAAAGTADAGVDGVTLGYTLQGGAIVTDALGHQTNYGLTALPASGVPRKVDKLVDSDGTNNRSIDRTYYDESVDFRLRLDTVTDRNGVQTKHTYAEITDPVTGQPASVHTTVEAVGTPQARTLVERATSPATA